MASVHRSVEVARPLPLVQSYLADFRTTAQWDPNTISCRRLDSGPLRVGSTFKNRQRVGPLWTTLTYVMRVLDSDLVVLSGHNWLLRTRDEMRFSVTAQGLTRLDYLVDAHVGRELFDALLQRRLGAIADRAVKSLQASLLRLPADTEPGDAV